MQIFSAFVKPEFVGQAKIRRYVIMSAIGCSVWTAGKPPFLPFTGTRYRVLKKSGLRFTRWVVFMCLFNHFLPGTFFFSKIFNWIDIFALFRFSWTYVHRFRDLFPLHTTSRYYTPGFVHKSWCKMPSFASLKMCLKYLFKFYPPTVLRIRDSMLFCPRDPGWKKSGSGINISDHISGNLITIFGIKNT